MTKANSSKCAAATWIFSLVSSKENGTSRRAPSFSFLAVSRLDLVDSMVISGSCTSKSCVLVGKMCQPNAEEEPCTPVHAH